MLEKIEGEKTRKQENKKENIEKGI